jgi:GNAT superfamily N-acetyltransferase
MTIRPSLPSDADTVFLHLGKFATSYKPARSDFDTNYPIILGSDGSDLLVAEQGVGRVVCNILASDSPTLFANGVVTEFLELYMDEQERGKGMGRALVKWAVARAEERGVVKSEVLWR